MPEVEYVTTANHAEAINGLLYLSGAGWTDHWRVPGPDGSFVPSHLGFGVSILVGWNETNRRHHLALRIEGEDGSPEIAVIETDLEVGRPPGSPPGSDFRSVLAANLDATFERSGGYRVTAQIGESQKSVSFRVHDQPPQGVPR